MRVMLFVFVPLMVFGVACSSESTPDEDAAPTVVGRIAEVHGSDTTSMQFWFPHPDSLSGELTPRDFSWKFENTDPESPVGYQARFTLTIRDEVHVYDVQVPSDCYDAIRVGDDWPRDIEACR